MANGGEFNFDNIEISDVSDGSIFERIGDGFLKEMDPANENVSL
jgi:hypothetical protein